MFASVRAKSPAHATPWPAKVKATPWPANVAHQQPDSKVVGRAPMLQRTVGNQAMLRMLSSAESDPGVSMPGERFPQERSWFGTSNGGRPLDAAVRAPFERRFAFSFADVRIHDDAEAADAARAVDARAYTLGNHIVFGAGAYAPQSAEGRATLAHELTHVVQHRGTPASGAVSVSAPAGPAEREADSIAERSGDARESAFAVHQRTLPAVLHRQSVHMASGRFVGDRPGPDNNRREEVTNVIDALARLSCLSQPDYAVEYPAVQALPAASSVPIATIPKTIAGIKAAEEPVLDKSSAQTELGLPLTAAVGRAQPNAKPDILAVQDQLHVDWHLTNPDYDGERISVNALPGPTVPDATIPKTIAGIGKQKIAIVAGQTGEKYRHELAVSLKMEQLVGQTATWTGSGPGSGNTFETWASAATEAAAGPLPAVVAATKINCWEMVLVAALQANLINWTWVHTLYTTSIGAGWGAHLVDTLSRGARVPYHVGDPNTPRPNRGQVVFFNGAAHVALGNGIVDGTGRAQVWTFWPPPGTAFTPGGTLDQVKLSTIEELVNFMVAHFGPTAVEISLPPW
jgi:hypothetical protein